MKRYNKIYLLNPKSYFLKIVTREITILSQERKFLKRLNTILIIEKQRAGGKGIAYLK